MGNCIFLCRPADRIVFGCNFGFGYYYLFYFLLEKATWDKVMGIVKMGNRGNKGNMGYKVDYHVTIEPCSLLTTMRH